MTTEIGKIESVKFGIGGYQDVMIGLHVTLSGKGWGVNDSKAAWDFTKVQRSLHTQWTEENRSQNYADIIRYVSKLLDDAKVSSLAELEGKPVEATFNNNTLFSWRILTEVL
jgi:hypothetical protein